MFYIITLSHIWRSERCSVTKTGLIEVHGKTTEQIFREIKERATKEWNMERFGENYEKDEDDDDEDRRRHRSVVEFYYLEKN